MHHRSGGWVKGHSRNGTWIAGHYRKGAYVSDYLRHFSLNVPLYVPSSYNTPHTKNTEPTENQSEKVFAEAEKQNKKDLIFRLYGIDNYSIGYTVDCNLDYRKDVEKLFEISSDIAKIKDLISRINSRFNHQIYTSIPELCNQALQRKHWYNLEELAKKACLGEEEIIKKPAIKRIHTEPTENQSEKVFAEAEKQNKKDLIFRLYGIDNYSIGYTVDCNLDYRKDVEKLFEISSDIAKIKDLISRINSRFNHQIYTSIPELCNQALQRKHWYNLEELAKKACFNVR